MDYGDEVAKRTLEGLPKGRFSIEEEQDSGAVYRVASRSPTRSSSSTSATTPTRTGPEQRLPRRLAGVRPDGLHEPHRCPGSANAGHFRRLKLFTRPGSVFDPNPPAAFATYYEVEIRLYDLLWRCLAPHLGGRLPAGSFGSICGTFIGGPHPDTGRHFTIVEPQVGGWGGSARATATARCSAASTATPSTAPPRSPRPATASTSSGSRSTTPPAARGSIAAARASSSSTACAPTAASSPAPTRATSTGPGRRPAGSRVRRTIGGRARRRLGRELCGRHGAAGQRGRPDPHPHRQRRRLRRPAPAAGRARPRRPANGYVTPALAREVYGLGG